MVIPFAEVVVGGGLELRAKDFEEAVDVLEIGVGVGEEERGGVLHIAMLHEINEVSTI